MQQHCPARVTRVSAAQAIAVAGGLYQPIRRTLDVRAFGVNAYFAPTAGNQLIERHDETGTGAGGHAELYVVLSGHATFVVDSEVIDAPARAMVFVPDPTSKREATAIVDDTSALVIGGPADRQLPVSPFEYWFTAEGPYKAGEYAQAIEIVLAGLEEHPEHPTMLYQPACYYVWSALIRFRLQIGRLRATDLSFGTRQGQPCTVAYTAVTVDPSAMPG